MAVPLCGVASPKPLSAQLRGHAHVGVVGIRRGGRRGAPVPHDAVVVGALEVPPERAHAELLEGGVGDEVGWWRGRLAPKLGARRRLAPELGAGLAPKLSLRPEPATRQIGTQNSSTGLNRSTYGELGVHSSFSISIDHAMRHLLHAIVHKIVAFAKQAFGSPVGNPEHDGWSNHNERTARRKYKPGAKFNRRRFGR